MRRVVIAATVGVLVARMAAAPAPVRHMARAMLEDKIRGGWAGKMIGVSYGAPTEFQWKGRINEEAIAWSPERVSNALEQDDLYVGMTLAETMDRVGLDADVEQYGEAFKRSEYSLWHANAAARRLLNLGVKAGLTGEPRYNVHANDIDFQIESDFIGLMAPGLPRASNTYCLRVGRVMTYGDGLYGGMFVAGMYTAAFFASDVRRVVEQGLACLPPDSRYAAVVRDVLAWSAQSPGDWRKVWRLVEDKWDRDDSCPEGALAPFNIDAAINGAYVAIGLLCGGGDFGRTLEIAARSGQDSDCNPSTAGGILGVMLGYARIPDEWKSGIGAIADRRFAYTHSSLDDICRSTLDRALALVKRSGGKVTADEVSVPRQAPVAAPLEQWEMGVAVARVKVDAPAWRVKGFSAAPGPADEQAANTAPRGVRADGPGAEAVFTFTGSAVAILGEFSTAGGRADVYLDGNPARPIDAYVGERTYDNTLWHTYGLRPGVHSVRIVARQDADSRSTGRTLSIHEAVVYRAK